MKGDKDVLRLLNLDGSPRGEPLRRFPSRSFLRADGGRGWLHRAHVRLLRRGLHRLVAVAVPNPGHRVGEVVALSRRPFVEKASPPLSTAKNNF